MFSFITFNWSAIDGYSKSEVLDISNMKEKNAGYPSLRVIRQINGDVIHHVTY